MTMLLLFHLMSFPCTNNTTHATMPKERNYNPVQAQRKADKAKALKKGP
jgi:hypothetical protein